MFEGGYINMELEGKKVGFALTGSFCTFKNTIPHIKKIVENGADVLPIMSFNAYTVDSRFGKAKDFIEEIEDITHKKIIHTIEEAEPIGPNNLTDIMIIAPCTGNTLSKLTSGITDGPVLMAAKSHLRNNNSLVIAVSTNDGLSGNASNIGTLLNRKNYFFVPFKQDNPITKPRSIVFSPEYIVKTLEQALDKTQIQPILL